MAVRAGVRALALGGLPMEPALGEKSVPVQIDVPAARVANVLHLTRR